MIRRKDSIQEKRKRDASISVEASIVMWIVVLVLSMVLLVFFVVKKQIAVYQTMYEAAQDAAVASVVKEEAMDEILVADSYHLWGARIRNEKVVFTAVAKEDGYEYSGYFHQNFPLISNRLYSLSMSQHLFVRSWGGYNRSKNAEVYVYITKTGRAYHSTTACSHLKLNIHEVPYEVVDKYRNDSGAKYYPCSSCGKRIGGGIVYITTDGDRYHGDRECKNLMRYIKKVLLDEVKDTHSPCKDCY